MNKADSGHEHGKRLALDRLDELCDMVGYICDIYGKDERHALRRAAEIGEKLDL